MPAVLAIRHVAFEDPGTIEDFLSRRGHRIDHLDAASDDLGSTDFLGPDLLVVLGGPIGAYEERSYPFLRNEIDGLAARLAAGRPTLGFCLGAQLMAAALGARVYPGGQKEIGWSALDLTQAGHEGPLRHLGGVPVLHWHGDTFDLPEGAVLLASTALYPHQVFSCGAHALAFQCHPEVTALGLERWLVGHALEISTTPGLDVVDLRVQNHRYAPALAGAFERVLGEWLAGTQVEGSW